DLVESSDIADDVDALDIDLRTLLDVEGYVNRALFPVPRNIRFDFDKGVTAIAERICQYRNRFFYGFGVVPIAGVNCQKRQHRLGRQILDLDVDIYFAEAIPLAFVQGEGDDEPVAIRGQFGDRRDHAEIRIPLGQIKPAQQLPIIGQSIRIV